MPAMEEGHPKRRKWIPLVALVGLSLFMYVSIMFKIIKFGP